MNQGLLDLIAALYRVLSGRHTDRGARRWFTGQLEEKRGLTISFATMSSWAKDGVPDERREDVDETVGSLYIDAHDKLVGLRGDASDAIDTLDASYDDWRLT